MFVFYWIHLKLNDILEKKNEKGSHVKVLLRQRMIKRCMSIQIKVENFFVWKII